MNYKKMNELPLKDRERIDKSCLICYELQKRFGSYPVSYKDYERIIVIDSEDFSNHFRVTDMYLKDRNDYLIQSCIEDNPSFTSIKYVLVAEVVLSKSGKILKNRWGIQDDVKKRWGVQDDEGRFTKMMDTMTYKEIKEYYEQH